MKIGMIFPGQGAQFVGMGKEFYDQERLMQEYFEQASICLKKNFVKLCFASSERELMETQNAQTAIFLVSASLVHLLKDRYDVAPTIVAGHSLGEYSALFAAQGINFADGLYLLNKRAQFMEEATARQNGGMLAVLNMPVETLETIVAAHDDPSGIERVAQIVNYNAPTQLVVSGTLPELEAIKEAVVAQKGRAIPLKVSGGFHSRLMQQAQERFAAYLTKVDIHDLALPLISNVDAQPIRAAHEVKDALVRQISAPVRWWRSMEHMADCDLILQIGPGDQMAKLLAREWSDKPILAFNTPEDLTVILEHLGKRSLLPEHDDQAT